MNYWLRRGFSYLQFLITAGLCLLLFVLVSQSFFGLLKKTEHSWQVLQEKRQLSQALDKISEDIVFADQVSVTNDALKFKKENINYQYLCHSQRLARIKDGYLYLTPKEMIIQEFSPLELRPGQYQLTIKSTHAAIIRIITRRP